MPELVVVSNDCGCGDCEGGCCGGGVVAKR